MLTTYEKNAKLKLVTTVVAILVIAGVVTFADHLKSAGPTSQTTLATPVQSDTTDSTDSSTTENATSNTTSNTSTSTSSGSYKDGTYTASSDYYVPHGQESIQVSLTLSSDTITSVSIKNSEGDHDSALFQEDFAAEYKQYVVGKKISSLHVNVLAGASDTTEGFNDALSQIASKAQA
jgi:uncharacterized protein with FMN-binding domain